MTVMSGFYQAVYQRFPEFLKRRINPLEFAIQEFVARMAREISAPSIVLDAGAGEVRFAAHFREARYLAVDLAVGDPEWDYSRIDVRANLEALPFRANSVDVVLNIQVLEHVRKPDVVVREFYRILKPGGKLLLTAPQGWHEHQKPHDYYRFTQYSLRELFRTAGFEDCRIEPMGGYFHYLGHRLTYIPKTIFQPRKGWERVVFFPLELASLVLFCFLLPVVCFYLDRLDGQKEFTLGYRCEAFKG